MGQYIDSCINSSTTLAGHFSYQDLCPGRYNGPQYAADTVDHYCGALGCQARILDMAAGTGFVGEKVHLLYT